MTDAFAIAKMASGDLIWNLHLNKDGEEDEGFRVESWNCGESKRKAMTLTKAER